MKRQRPDMEHYGTPAVLSLGSGGMRLEFPDAERLGPPGSSSYPVVKGGEGLVRLTEGTRG